MDRNFPYGLSLEPIQTRNLRDYSNTSSPSLKRVEFSTFFSSSNPNSCVQSCVQKGLEGGSVEAAAVTSSDLVQLVSGMRKLLQYAENTGFEGLPSTVESTLERLSPPNDKERQIAEEGLEPPTLGL